MVNTRSTPHRAAAASTRSLSSPPGEGTALGNAAVQAIACIRGTHLQHASINPGGGSLARGHPIGASGAILAVRLVHELTTRRPSSHGVATIAAAGGLGTALLLTSSG